MRVAAIRTARVHEVNWARSSRDEEGAARTWCGVELERAGRHFDDSLGRAVDRFTASNKGGRPRLDGDVPRPAVFHEVDGDEPVTCSHCRRLARG